MPPELFIVLPFALLAVALAVSWRWRWSRRPTWHDRFRLARTGVCLGFFVWLLLAGAGLLDPGRFWPQRALLLLAYTGFVGLLIHQWRHARRKAAEEPPPAPALLAPSRPTFLWQAGLILLPVVLLAGYGLWALRKERALIEEEVRERCSTVLQLLARELPRTFQQEISSHQESDRLHYLKLRADAGLFLSNSIVKFSASDADGNDVELGADVDRLIESRHELEGNFSFAEKPAARWQPALSRPPDDGWKQGFPRVPDWFRELPDEQRKDWQAIEYAMTAGQRDEALRLINDFIGGPSDHFAERNAEFLRRQLQDERIADWLQAATLQNSCSTPAGLPLSGLSLLRALELNGTNRFDNDLWAVLAHWFDQPPTVMTEAVMARVASTVATDDAIGLKRLAALKTLTRRHRATALLLDQLQADSMELPPPFAWVTSGKLDYLVWSGPLNDSPTNRQVHGVTVPRDWLVPRLSQAVASLATVLPDFVSLHLLMAGRSMPVANTMAGAAEGRTLAQETFVLPNFTTTGPPGPMVTLVAQNAFPELMYRRHEQRVWMIGSLILLAVIAALVGLWQTSRALRHQLALNELKTNFVSSVSHELRAPIASVRLMAENLERGKVTGADKLQEYVRFIGQECRRLSALIENVLDFGRIEHGRKQYEFEPTDLGKLVAESVRLMQPYAEERGVKLALEGRHSCRPIPSEGRDSCRPEQTDKEADIFTADGSGENQCAPVPDESLGDKSVALPLELNIDGRAIQQALVNLIDNAIKHSPAGATVEVRLHRRTGLQPVALQQLDPGASPQRDGLGDSDGSPETGCKPVLLSVTDHGPGIPHDEHEKIFERFYRRGSELRRETPGIGIGLSIVKHIIDAHHGRVWVESEPGQGSRFVIELKTDR